MRLEQSLVLNRYLHSLLGARGLNDVKHGNGARLNGARLDRREAREPASPGRKYAPTIRRDNNCGLLSHGEIRVARKLDP